MQRSSVKLQISLLDLNFSIEGPEPLARTTWDYLSKEIIPYLLRRSFSTKVENERETELEEFGGNAKGKIFKQEETKIENSKESLDQQLWESYKKKCPKTRVATATFFAYYLKHFKNKPEFSLKDLKLCYESINLPLSAKYPQEVWDAIYKYNFIEKGAEKGLYRITEKGEQYVEAMGQDNERARQDLNLRPTD